MVNESNILVALILSQLGPSKTSSAKLQAFPQHKPYPLGCPKKTKVIGSIDEDHWVNSQLPKTNSLPLEKWFWRRCFPFKKRPIVERLS